MCYLDTVKINCEGKVGKNANKKIYIYKYIYIYIYIHIYIYIYIYIASERNSVVVGSNPTQANFL